MNKAYQFIGMLSIASFPTRGIALLVWGSGVIIGLVVGWHYISLPEEKLLQIIFISSLVFGIFSSGWLLFLYFFEPPKRSVWGTLGFYAETFLDNIIIFSLIWAMPMFLFGVRDGFVSWNVSFGGGIIGALIAVAAFGICKFLYLVA